MSLFRDALVICKKHKTLELQVTVGVEGPLLVGFCFLVLRTEAQVDWGGTRDGGLQSRGALLTRNVKDIVSTGLMCQSVPSVLK